MKTKRYKYGEQTRIIREYLEKNPAASPSEVVARLAAGGHHFTTSQVSTVKSNRALLTAGSGGTPPGNRQPPNLITLENLLAAKQFRDSVGGPERAGELLDTLATLGC